jgi:hypothetical protein
LCFSRLTTAASSTALNFLQTAAWRKSDRKTNHFGQQLNNRTLLSDSLT